MCNARLIRSRHLLIIKHPLKENIISNQMGFYENIIVAAATLVTVISTCFFNNIQTNFFAAMVKLLKMAMKLQRVADSSAIYHKGNFFIHVYLMESVSWSHWHIWQALFLYNFWKCLKTSSESPVMNPNHIALWLWMSLLYLWLEG